MAAGEVAGAFSCPRQMASVPGLHGAGRWDAIPAGLRQAAMAAAEKTARRAVAVVDRDALPRVRAQRQSFALRGSLLRPPQPRARAGDRRVRRSQGPLPRRHRQRHLADVRGDVLGRSGACRHPETRRRDCPTWPSRPSTCSPPRPRACWRGPATCSARRSTRSRRCVRERIARRGRAPHPRRPTASATTSGGWASTPTAR